MRYAYPKSTRVPKETGTNIRGYVRVHTLKGVPSVPANVPENEKKEMNHATLHDIADRLERLAPSHRDPHRFHEEKSELVAEPRRLAANDNLRPAINKVSA